MCFQQRKKVIVTSCFSRGQKNSKKHSELIFKEQFCLSELQQITWCISTKQKYVSVSDLSNADYENVFQKLFDFHSICVDRDLERKIRLCFNKLSKYRKFPEFTWLFTTNILMNLSNISMVTFVSTGLKFSRSERCWKKLTMKLQKAE